MARFNSSAMMIMLIVLPMLLIPGLMIGLDIWTTSNDGATGDPDLMQRVYNIFDISNGYGVSSSSSPALATITGGGSRYLDNAKGAEKSKCKRNGKYYDNGWYGIEYGNGADSEGKLEECQLCFCVFNKMLCKECNKDDIQTKLLKEKAKAVDTNKGGHLKGTMQILANSYPRILCFVPVVYPFNAAVDVIKDTWAKHCDKFIFTSIVNDPEKGVVKLPITQGKDLWGIVHPAFTYIHDVILKQNGEHFDFILKADDDTYVVPENLKYLILKKGYKADDPHYLGLTAYHHGKDSPFNLGCGYALSRRALEIIAPHLPSSKLYDSNDRRACSNSPSWAEDAVMGSCLKRSNIYPNSTRDELERETFLVFHPADHLQMVRRKDSSGWFWQGKPSNVKHGGECCSARPVLWHGFKKAGGAYLSYYMLDYFMYELEVAPTR